MKRNNCRCKHIDTVALTIFVNVTVSYKSTQIHKILKCLRYIYMYLSLKHRRTGAKIRGNTVCLTTVVHLTFFYNCHNFLNNRYIS